MRLWCNWHVSRGIQFTPLWCLNQWQVMQTWRLRLFTNTC
jgi:hypothetical protein